MKNTSFYIATWSLCCLIGVGLFIAFFPIVTQPNGTVYDLQAGTSKSILAQDLTRQGAIKFPELFSLYAYAHVTTPLKSGEYLFKKGSTIASVWKQISTGAGYYNRSFTIVPGWTFKQLSQQLALIPFLQHKQGQFTGKDIMTYLGHPELSPEGQFYPDTYYYYKNNADITILKRAYRLMQSKLITAWLNRQAGLPYKNSYEALTAASLIEKEAYLNSDRPKIASVIVNRLKQNMILQIDPTVIYGLGDRYTGKLHKQDLQENTPYNTYVHTGLPPTPIAMPGFASIDAALHPVKSNFLYFVAKNHGDGSHQFSNNLRDHNAAVALALQHQDGFFNDRLVQIYIARLLSGSLE